MAVAAASMLFAAWLATSPGVSIAKWTEVWSQRALPGGTADTLVEPEWSTPGSLNSMGLLVYEEQPARSFFICVPGAVGMIVLSLSAAIIHGLICAAVARLYRLPASSTVPAMPMVRAKLYRVSAVMALAVLCGYSALRWAWAGAARGSITQRVVGGEHVDFVFGPFGRSIVLVGAVALYFGIVLWTARSLAKRGATESFSVRPIGKPFTAIALTVVAFVLIAFPYWGPQAARLLGQDAAMNLGKWSETTSLRPLLDGLAPMPR